MTIKYPDVKVKLVGEDGNAFLILGKVSRALRRAHVPAHEIESFMLEATSGSYDHLLSICMDWVSIE